MADVVATERGYFGGEIREIGQRFDVPDELWNDEKRRPKWAKPAKFGGKGDHDGDGKIGGAKPDPERKGKGRGKTVEAPVAEPFADAPAPVRVENEVNKALGAIEPDWVAPPAI